MKRFNAASAAYQVETSPDPVASQPAANSCAVGACVVLLLCWPGFSAAWGQTPRCPLQVCFSAASLSPHDMGQDDNNRTPALTPACTLTLVTSPKQLCHSKVTQTCLCDRCPSSQPPV